VTPQWIDATQAETGYEVWRARKRRGKYACARIASAGVDTSAHLDRVSETGDYRSFVCAVNDADSLCSPSVAVKVDSLGSAPDPEPEPDPGTLAAPVLSYSTSGWTVCLSWTHSCPEGVVCTYTLERGDARTKGQINFSAADGVCSVDPSRKAATCDEGSGTFYYRVTASDGAVVSDFSNTVSVRNR